MRSSSAEAAVLEAILEEEADRAGDLLADFLPGELRALADACKEVIDLAGRELKRPRGVQ